MQKVYYINVANQRFVMLSIPFMCGNGNAKRSDKSIRN